LGSHAKLQRLTDWQPQYTLAQGLQETIAWMEQNLDRYKTDIYNL